MATSRAGRLGVLSVVLALLLPACFLRSVVGRVSVESLGEELEAIFAAVSTNATVAVCVEDSEFEDRIGTCTYIIDGEEVASTVTLRSEFGLFGVLIDPLVLQLPDDVLGVTATFNNRGIEEQVEVALSSSFDADASTTVTAEPGTRFAILELPGQAQQQLADQPEGGRVEFDFDLRVEMPRLEPLIVKPMFALRVEADGRVYHPPMLPCVTDFSQVPAIEIPVADAPENLLDDLGAALGQAAACQDVTYDFSGGVDRVGRFVRIAGPDRIATAIEVSRATYPESDQAANVVIARADAFPDALAGTPLAWALGAPILLTSPDSLDPRVAEELQRVIPTDFAVTVLGGTAAISEAVVQQIEALGYQVFRYGGANRFETAAAIAGRNNPRPQDPVYLADGGTFPAALLAGAAATNTIGRVLLTSDGQLPEATRAWLEDHPQTPQIAVGDQAVAAAPAATPIAGSEPSALSVAVAQHTFTEPPAEVFLASATVFADGLTGGPLTGPRTPFAHYTGGALLLTDPDALPQPVREYLATVGPSVERAAAFGGSAAVTDAVLDDASGALG